MLESAPDAPSGAVGLKLAELAAMVEGHCSQHGSPLDWAAAKRLLRDPGVAEYLDRVAALLPVAR